MIGRRYGHARLDDGGKERELIEWVNSLNGLAFMRATEGPKSTLDCTATSIEKFQR